MRCLTYLTTLLWIGRIVDTHGFPLELTKFQSGDDATLVCTATNTTINIVFTQWYMDEVRVLTSVFAGNVCHKHPPNSTGDTYAYSYDLYTLTDVSVSCGDHKHNMTLTTTQDLHDDTVWRCEDQQYRVSNNLTLGFAVTTNNTSSQLTDSATTLAKLTTVKTTTPPSNDNQDDTMYIAAWAGGGIMILIIIVICVGVVRRRRTRKVTQAFSDADNGEELSENPTYARNQDEAADNKELLTNKTTVHQPAVVGAVNVDDVYAVPDKTPKHLSAVRGAVNVDDLYAVPDKTPKHQSAVRGAVNVDDLYVVPGKTPKHQSAARGVVNDGDMYAVPDKRPKHQPAVGGAVNVDDLYAVPDMSMKTTNGTYNSRSEVDSEI